MPRGGAAIAAGPKRPVPASRVVLPRPGRRAPPLRGGFASLRPRVKAPAGYTAASLGAGRRPAPAAAASAALASRRRGHRPANATRRTAMPASAVRFAPRPRAGPRRGAFATRCPRRLGPCRARSGCPPARLRRRGAAGRRPHSRRHLSVFSDGLRVFRRVRRRSGHHAPSAAGRGGTLAVPLFTPPGTPPPGSLAARLRRADTLAAARSHRVVTWWWRCCS
jgi:hypothetical protein